MFRYLYFSFNTNKIIIIYIGVAIIITVVMTNIYIAYYNVYFHLDAYFVSASLWKSADRVCLYVNILRYMHRKNSRNLCIIHFIIHYPIDFQ